VTSSTTKLKSDNDELTLDFNCSVMPAVNLSEVGLFLGIFSDSALAGGLNLDDDHVTSAATDTGGVAGRCCASMCSVDAATKLASDNDDLTSAATDSGGVAGGCSASMCNVDEALKLSSDNDDLRSAVPRCATSTRLPNCRRTMTT